MDLTRHNLGWTLLLLILLLLLFEESGSVGIILHSDAEGLRSGFGPLGVLMEQGAALLNGWIVRSVKMILLLWNGLVITQIIMQNRVLLERTYLPAILYIMLACACSPTLPPVSVLFASLLLILAYAALARSFQRTIVFRYTFNAGFALGTAALIYAPTLLITPVLLSAGVVFNKELREAISMATGWIMPLIACSYIYWGLGHNFSYIPFQLWEALQEGLRQPHSMASLINPLMLTFLTISVATTVAAFIAFVKFRQTIRTRPYKTFQFFCWVLLWTSLLFAFPGRNNTLFTLLAIPMALIIPTFFRHFVGRIANTAYFLMWGTLLAYHLIVL